MTRPATPRSELLTYGAFGALVVLVGANFIAVKVSNLELPPFWGGGLRFSIASALFALIIVARRITLPRGRALGAAALYGLIGFGIPFGLIYWSVVELPAGFATVLMALVPLFTVILAIGHRLERFRWPAVAGGCLAVVGIGIGYGALDVAAHPLSILGLIVAALAFAETNIVAKRLPPMHPVAANAVGTAVGALLLLGLSVLLGEPRPLPDRPETWLALAYVVSFGTLVVFVLFLFVVKRLPASTVAYEFVLAPIVTAALALVLLAEPITPVGLVGGAIVLIAVYLGAFAPIGKAAPVPT
jgi:drug/metabolite transporter (DMT)-like permease